MILKKNKYIPQIEPWFTREEERQLKSVIKSTFITENKKTEEFLDRIKAYTKAKYAICVGNGTLGLISALIAEDIGFGDEVIVPDLTFIATANAVRLVGATPIFCDVNKDNGCIQVENFEKLVSNKTKAIIPVHLYGDISPMKEIMTFAREKNLIVIEDAAEAFGIWNDGKHMGTLGDYGVFSLFANKTITSGEGGIILTNSSERLQKLYRIKNHGRDKKGIFIHENFGYNFCFSDLHAAVGVAQLKKIELILKKKKANYIFYKENLEEVKEVRLMEINNNVKSNHWFNNILVENPDKLEKYLSSKGIGTRRLFFPMHKQPCFEQLKSYEQSNYINSNYLYNHGLSLPSSPMLSKKELKRVVSTIKDYFKK